MRIKRRHLHGVVEIRLKVENIFLGRGGSFDDDGGGELMRIGQVRST